MKNLDTLQKQINHHFSDPSLLQQALTHRSMAGQKNNERLEFLGDAVLGHIIGELLYSNYPKAREGELSRMRASLVRGEHLAKAAKRLSLGTHLRLGVGEKKSGGEQRISILADALEALIGAVYLDAGFEACKKVVFQIYQEEIDTLSETISEKDAKSLLQEWLQAHKLPLPNYDAVTTGEAHAQIFHVTCRVEGLPHETKGTSTSRRKAEQAAAEAYLELLDVQS